MTPPPRKAIKKISDKRLKSLGGKTPFSSISKRSESPRKLNPKRKASEFRRAYHSKERVLFVKGLPCSACGVVGYSENAHVPPKGEAGTGYKADYRFIAPLCGIRPISLLAVLRFAASTYAGCHTMFARYRSDFNAAFPDFAPEVAAAEAERAWKAHTEEGK